VVRKSARTRKTKPKKSSIKSSTKRKKQVKNFQLKNVLNSVFIWTLVVVNVVLIASMINRLIVTPGNKTPELNVPGAVENQLKVEVLNGCGVNGLAHTFKEILQNHNYDVVAVGNAESMDYDKSIIIDRGRRPEKDIKDFCRFIGIKTDNIVRINNSDLQVDIRFIIGADYTKLKAYRNYR